MYKIKSITCKDGTDRMDGRYPLRKGCIVRICHLNAGDVMLFEYLEDNQGNRKEGYLKTSIVEKCNLLEDGMDIYTMNSVYHLESLNKRGDIR